MNLWLDGLFALIEHAWAAFVVFLVILWGFFIIRGLLISLFGEGLTESDLFSLSAAGWVVPAFFLSIFAFGTSLLFKAFIADIFAVAAILISSFVLIRKAPPLPHILILTAILIPSLIPRFAFIADLVVPSYFDSAEHYRLIHSGIETYRTGILSTGFQGVFYHLGFHSLAAFISHFMHVDILDLMFAFGQVILTVFPIPFFFIVKRETDSTPAAFFACLLAGFGFHMPAHLMNWGKYPALLGFIAILFVFGLVYMAYRSDLFKPRRSIFVLLGCTALVSALIHSRTLVLFGMIFIAALITFGWHRLRASYRLSGFILLIGLLAIEFYAVQHNTALQLLLNSYLTNDSGILILILLLAIASAMRYTKSTFFLLTWLVLCSLCLFIPIAIPTQGNQTLLDRPFVQVLIVIPLSILGGFGLASVTQWTKRLFPDLSLIQHFLIYLLFGFVLLNTALNYRFAPSDCCRFVTRDDLAAFTWLDATLPSDATILIASADLFMTTYETSENQYSVDAGIWIPPLISRKTVYARQETQFDEADVHADLCTYDIEYIYIGGAPQSFKVSQFEKQPAWYSPALVLPSAKVYQVLGCNG